MRDTEKYPECEKLAHLSQERRIVHEFLEQLATRGISLCKVEQYDRYYPIAQSDDSLFMECYGIDPNKLEKERRAMLDSLQNG